MRGLFFFGRNGRNQPIRLEDPRPVADRGRTSIESGNAGLDGFSVLSRANPDAQGNPPPVKGVVGPVCQGPDESFEQ